MTFTYKGYGQFSPGELTRAHHFLEGTQQCARCHDVGKEISGSKCLTCHLPVKRELDTKRGYHFSVSAKKCIACHKDHLGLDARITIVDPLRIDHDQTGFSLTGKHRSLTCEQCHASQHIKDPSVISALSSVKHTIYLGLETACLSCHEDRHQGKLGSDCQSCHTTTAWSSIPSFDHSRTKFALTGKHSAVKCALCHTSIVGKANHQAVDFTTKGFADCTPCHSSPHTEKFSHQSCSSCHSTPGWAVASSSTFDHNLTAFKLRGKHANIKCEQCHHGQSKNSTTFVLNLPHARCTDCHKDYHEGQFAKNYNSDCAKCHTEEGFSPSTFTITQHQTVFALRGAHGATPCMSCHTKVRGGVQQFHFANTTCVSCHQDPHKGEFNKLMGKNGCSFCHATTTWKEITFDHTGTKFPLEGKHVEAACSQCHRSTIITDRKGNTLFKGLGRECESCHKDVHARQFAVKNVTDCASCHQPKGWALLLFDHDARSVFKLTGAHSKVECRACHTTEHLDKKLVVRYKPLATACESCHKGNKQ